MAKRRGARVCTVVGASALTIALAACSGGGGGAGGGGGENILVAYTGEAGDFQINFNPFSPSNVGGRGTIYEPLFFYNKAQASEPQPLLGTDFSWNDDGTELSITVRDDAEWSDGEPFTAEDVAFTFDMIADTPAINNIGYDGDAEATSDTELTVTFDEPAYVSGPDLLAQWIVPQHLWQDINPTEDVIEEPIGTGAFVLDEFRPQAFTLRASESHWDGAPAIDGVRYVSLSGNQAGADALAAGTIDWQTGPVPDMENVSTNYPGYEAVSGYINQAVLATCSNADLGCEGPQTDPAVRQALSHALDREQLNSLAFQSTGEQVSPTFVLMPAQEQWISPEYADDPFVDTEANIDEARSILEDAGWTEGSGGIYEKDGERLNLTIEVVTGWTDYITAIDTISAQAEAAGIGITSSQSSWNEWTDKKQQGNFQVVIDSLGQGPAADPYYVYQYFFSGTAPVGEASGNPFARFENADVDAALDELRQLDFDDPARQELLTTIQDIVAEDMPYVPMITGANTSQWNVEKYSGWPTQDDLYAFPAIWSAIDASVILKNLTPNE